MAYSFFTMAMMRTALRLSLATWVAISFPLVNVAIIVSRSSSGNCPLDEFWHEPINACIPCSVQLSSGAPPFGEACPSNGNWYWSNQLSCCLPTSPEMDILSPSAVVCPDRYAWDAATSRCTQVKNPMERSTVCDSTEFWFSDKAICLPRRNVIPASINCPSEWYWSTQSNNCAPANAEVMESSATSCTNGYVWSRSALICQRAVSQSGAPSQRPSPTTSQLSTSPAPSRRPTPSPSPGKYSRRHTLKSRMFSLCPARLDACPIFESAGLSDFECVDSRYDLQHCGGCSTDGRGEDCTAIRGVWNVECINTRCSVLTCTTGYVPSIDRKTCIKL